MGPHLIKGVAGLYHIPAVPFSEEGMRASADTGMAMCGPIGFEVEGGVLEPAGFQDTCTFCLDRMGEVVREQAKLLVLGLVPGEEPETPEARQRLQDIIHH